MAITLTTAFLAELKKNANQPNVIIEVSLDSGAVKWGTTPGGFTDVLPIVKSVSSLQNKIDTKAGYSTRGQLTVVITGRDNFKSLIANNYLKNRRVTRKDGFIASGFAYSDYAATFTGRISDWSRKGDELTITVSDDLIDAAKKIPVENTAKTQKIIYANMAPPDIIKDILLTQLGIDPAYVNSTAMDFERDTWLQGWKFDRVITGSKAANDYLDELQAEANSYLIHDGAQISFKVFAPPLPNTAEEWTHNQHIQSGSVSQKSGYIDNFFNRLIVYYDYDESGDDKPENFETWAIVFNTPSQGAGQWNEVKTKEIKSRWIRTQRWSQPVNVTGVTIYMASRNNPAGNGILAFDKASNALTWTPPGGTIGAPVAVSSSGKYDIAGLNPAQYIRVVVDTSLLPSGNATDFTIAITATGNDSIAATLGQKVLNRYSNPAGMVSLDIDINNCAYNAQFVKPTDVKAVTTDEAGGKGAAAWVSNKVMLTSVRSDFTARKIAVEGIETQFYHRYGFIAPAGLPDYPSGTPEQKEYAYIGSAGNMVNSGAEDGYYVWFLPWLIFLFLIF